MLGDVELLGSRLDTYPSFVTCNIHVFYMPRPFRGSSAVDYRQLLLLLLRWLLALDFSSDLLPAPSLNNRQLCATGLKATSPREEAGSFPTGQSPDNSTVKGARD